MAIPIALVGVILWQLQGFKYQTGVFIDQVSDVASDTLEHLTGSDVNTTLQNVTSTFVIPAAKVIQDAAVEVIFTSNATRLEGASTSSLHSQPQCEEESKWPMAAVVTGGLLFTGYVTYKGYQALTAKKEEIVVNKKPDPEPVAPKVAEEKVLQKSKWQEFLSWIWSFFSWFRF